MDIQSVFPLEDGLCPRLQNIQSKSKTNGLIKLAFDNQPVLHRRIGCVEGITRINQKGIKNAEKARRRRRRQAEDEYALDNQPVLHYEDRLCRGQKIQCVIYMLLKISQSSIWRIGCVESKNIHYKMNMPLTISQSSFRG